METKCPFNQRDNYISEAVENYNLYLTKMNNSIRLPVTHQHYYQIQTLHLLSNMQIVRTFKNRILIQLEKLILGAEF